MLASQFTITSERLCRVFLTCLLLGCILLHQALSAAELDSTLPSVRSIYRNYIEANGGYLHMESLSSIAMKASVDYCTGESIEISIYRKRPNKLRLRKNFKNYTEEVIYDGHEGWRELSSLEGYQIELKRLQSDETARAHDMSHIEGPFFFVGRDERNISAIEMDEVEGISSYRVEVNPQAGLPFQAIWLDAKSFEEIKVARTSDREGRKVLEEIYFRDSTSLEGHTFYRKQTVYVDGILESTLNVRSIRINLGVYDKFFSIDSDRSSDRLSVEVEL